MGGDGRVGAAPARFAYDSNILRTNPTDGASPILYFTSYTRLIRAATQLTLLEYPSDLIEGSAHVLALAERFASYATALRTSIRHATDIEAVGSAALYTDITRGVEKRLGLLEAHLHR